MKYKVEGYPELEVSQIKYSGKDYKVGDIDEEDGSVFIGVDETGEPVWATPEDYKTKIKPALMRAIAKSGGKVTYTIEGYPELDLSPIKYKGVLYLVGDVDEEDGSIFIGKDPTGKPVWATPEDYKTKIRPVLDQLEKEFKEQATKEGEGVDNRRVVLSSLGGTGGAIIGTGAGPVGSAIGGILGATIGAQVDRLLDAWEKYQKAKAEGKEVEEPNWIKSLYEIGKDLATEAQYEAVGMLLPPALRTAWNALKKVGAVTGSIVSSAANRFAPKLAEGASEAIKSIEELVAKPKVLRSYIPKIERGIESIIENAKKNPDTAVENVVDTLTPERLERLEPTMLRDMASQVDIPPGATPSRRMQKLEQEEYALGEDRAERVAKEYKKALSQLDEAAKPTTAKLADEVFPVKEGEYTFIPKFIEKETDKVFENISKNPIENTIFLGKINDVRAKYAISAKGKGSTEVLNRLSELAQRSPRDAYYGLSELYEDLLTTNPEQAALLRPHVEEIDRLIDIRRTPKTPYRGLSTSYDELRDVYENLLVDDPERAALLRPEVEKLGALVDRSRTYKPSIENRVDDPLWQGYDDISVKRDAKRLALMPEKEQVRSPEFARIISYVPTNKSVAESIGNIVYRDLFGKADDPQQVMRVFKTLPPAIQEKLIDGNTLAQILRHATVRKYLNAGLERLSKEKAQDGISSIVKRGIGKILVDAASIGGINVVDFVSQLNSYMSNGVIKPQLYDWARRYANNFPGHTGGAMETGYNFAVGLAGLAREILQRAYIRSIGEEGRLNREIESEMFGVTQPNPFIVYPPKSLSELVEAAKNNYASPFRGAADIYSAWKPQAFVKDDQNQNNPNDNSTKTQKGPKNK